MFSPRLQRLFIAYFLYELEKPRVIQKITRHIHSVTAPTQSDPYTDAKAVAAVEGEATLDLTGVVTLANPPVADSHASTKKYVDDTVGGAGDLKADGSVPLTANWDAGAFTITANQFNLNTNEKIQLRDSDIYINSDDDEHLDLHSDTYIDLHATYVDIDAGYLRVKDTSKRSEMWGGFDLLKGANLSFDNDAATAGTTVRSPGKLYWYGHYWTGAADASTQYEMEYNVYEATPKTRLNIKDQGNYLAVWYYNQELQLWSHIYPWPDNSIDIGKAGQEIKDIYVDGVLYADEIQLETTEKIQFRDAAISIASLNDGHLDLTADSSVDVNGDLAVSGDITAGGDSVCKIKTGEYTGDNNATQAVTGVGFQPLRVEVYAQLDDSWYGLCIKTDQDGSKAYLSKPVGSDVYEDDQIVSLNADGFTVGDGTGGEGNIMNVNTRVYTYTCYGA